MSGTLTGCIGAGIQAFSPDGIHWSLPENPLALSLDITMEDGSIRHMGNMDRPFLYCEEGVPRGLFVATNDGQDAGFQLLSHSWNAYIPLKEPTR